MKNNRNIVILILLIITIASITGFIYGTNKTIEVTEFIENIKNNKSNLFFIHSIYILITFFSTLALINIISEPLILGIEGLSIGFTTGVLFKCYKLNGLFFGLLNNIVNKLIFLLIMSYLLIISINYTNKTIKNVLGLKNDNVKNLLKPLIVRFSIMLCISLINDTIIYFLGNMFLKNFINML